MFMANIILSGVDDKVVITVCAGAVLFCLALYQALCRYSRGQRTPVHRMVNVHSYNNDVCPICLGTHKLAIKTNCGHDFCGSCLKSYLNRSTGDFMLFSRPLTCPLCRQTVNILLICFSPEDLASADLREERALVERFVHEYNVRFGGGPRSLLSYITDSPVLVMHMFSNFFTFGGLVWVFRLRVFFCCLGTLVYFFNPLDIIPEAVFGLLGLFDDVIIFVLCLVYMSIIYRRLIISRATAST